MGNGTGVESLSWGDAIFLYLEREGAPLHIASLNVFEGRIPLARCRRFIESKLPIIPRYRQRVITAPLNIGLPTWEYDGSFDIRNHVREVKLGRGTRTEMQAAASRILSERMDRQHPLWDFTLFPLRENATAILARVHHCLADGLAGVGIMNAIMDAAPIRHRLPRKPLAFDAPAARNNMSLLLDGFLSTYADLVQRLLSAQEQAVILTQKVLAANGQRPAGDLLRSMPELGAATERLRFNVVCQGPQKFVWTELPLAELKAVREVWGGTINDIILTLITATIRRYLQAHGDPVRGHLFRMMVPVNVRSGDARDLGNRISLVPVTVPLGINSPRQLLAAVRQRTEFLKAAHVAEMVSLAGGLIGLLPTALQALAGPVAGQLPITPFNMVCTNVHGPESPLYLLGHKMLEWYPYVPIGGQMAVNCAVLSYNGVTYFGFSGDVHAAPDLQRMRQLFQASRTEMLKAAGYHPRARPRQRTEAATESKTGGSETPPERVRPAEDAVQAPPREAPRPTSPAGVQESSALPRPA